MRGARLIRTVALLGLLLPTGFSWAQSSPAGAGADEAVRAARKEARERLRNEVLDQMRTMRVWKLTEELKLDQAAAAKVFPVLAQYDERGQEIARERGEIAREVNEQVKTDRPDQARLRLLIDRLIANQSRRNALEDERFKALRPALTPLQQAKLLLLLPKIEDEFRYKIREAMRAQRAAEERADADSRSAPR